MQNSVSAGDRLLALRKGRGLSRDKLAKQMEAIRPGTHPQTILRLERGTIGFDEDWAKVFAKVFEVEPATFFDGEVPQTSGGKTQARQTVSTAPASDRFNYADNDIFSIVEQKHSIRKAPLIGDISAGNPAEIVESFDPEGPRVPVLADRDTLIALQVKGTSLNRMVPEGHVAVIDYTDIDPVSGRFYVIRIDGEVTLKRFRSNPERWEPYSTDPQHETIFPRGPVEVLGRLVWAGKPFA